jgi:hypothetical protein
MLCSNIAWNCSGGFSQPAIGFLQLKAHRLAFAGGCLIGGSAHAPPTGRTKWQRIFEIPEPGAISQPNADRRQTVPTPPPHALCLFIRLCRRVPKVLRVCRRGDGLVASHRKRSIVAGTFLVLRATVERERRWQPAAARFWREQFPTCSRVHELQARRIRRYFRSTS